MTIPIASRGTRFERAGSNSAGFTLLELIVAAGILALIAVFSWRGLDTLLREREAIASSQETIDAMQRSFARFERDAMLARDAQLDGSGTLRLVSGDAAVEYRFTDGALTRSIDGADGSDSSGGAGPMLLQTGIAKLAFEAWTAGAKGGWVRVKGLATEPLAPPPQQPRPAGAANGPGNAGAANANAPAPPAANPAAGGAPNPPATAGNPNAAAGPLTALGQPLVEVATGIRLSIARADGTEVVRVFLIGAGG